MADPSLQIPLRTVTMAQWVDAAHSTIQAGIDGADLFVPNDPENPHRRAIAAWEDAGNTITPEPAAPSIIPETISDRQFFQQLAMESVITQDEALAAVATGAIPTAMETLINGLPAEQQFGAKMQVSGSVEFHRHGVLTEQIRVAYGWTPEQTDALWIAASAL